MDEGGRSNLAPYSFFNAFCDEPHIIGFCSNGWKDTVANVAKTRQFVWNLATRSIAPAMNATSASVPHEVDEFVLAGLTKLTSCRVKPYRVQESPVTFECACTQLVQLQDAHGVPVEAWMVFGEVIEVHIDKSLITDGVYHTAQAHPVLRGGGNGEYAEIHAEAIFSMQAPD